MSSETLEGGVDGKITEVVVAIDGGVLNNEQARLIHGEIKSIGEEVSPAQIVDWAGQHPGSELYKHFEWDESKAAQKWRICEARRIVRSIAVKVIENGQSAKLRAFHSVVVNKPDDESARRYVRIESISVSKDKTQQVIENAKRELMAWKNRYRQYSSLLGRVFESVDAIDL